MKKQWILATTVGTMMASASCAALAQGMAMSGGIDYSVLGKRLPYDYSTLKAAKAAGYSDNQVATMVKIASLTGNSLSMVLHQVQNGATFGTLAYENNLKLSDVLDASDYKDKVANYEAAYESTGKGAAMKSGMSGSMGTMPMSSTTTSMTPAPMASAPMADSASAAGATDIVATAVAAGNFRRLVALINRAGLTETLKGPGPFTVFAPTDEAFAKIPRATLRGLSQDQLKKILTYHVIPGKITAADAMAMTSPTSPATVEGDTLQVTTSNGMVMINGTATVTKADIQCSNGVIHVIDTVLMPPAK